MSRFNYTWLSNTTTTTNNNQAQGLTHVKYDNLHHPTRQAPQPGRNAEGMERRLEKAMEERDDEYQLLPGDQL